jgi:hypothetical protein
VRIFFVQAGYNKFNKKIYAFRKEAYMMADEIPWEKAVQLGIEIEQRNRKRWYTPNGMMCYFCSHFSKGVMCKRCIGGEGH